jgi:hypothetical protein
MARYILDNGNLEIFIIITLLSIKYSPSICGYAGGLAMAVYLNTQKTVADLCFT